MNNVYDRLWIGDRNDLSEPQLLRDNDIDTVIALSENISQPVETIDLHKHPLPPSSEVSYEAFDKAVTAVIKAWKENKTVLVQCDMGVSRSVAVTATAVAALQDKSLRCVLNQIEKRHPASNPHPDLIDNAISYLDESLASKT